MVVLLLIAGGGGTPPDTARAAPGEPAVVGGPSAARIELVGDAVWARAGGGGGAPAGDGPCEAPAYTRIEKTHINQSIIILHPSNNHFKLSSPPPSFTHFLVHPSLRLRVVHQRKVLPQVRFHRPAA
jgi:hypothetical protein